MMECNKQNFLSLWTISYPLTPVTTQKIKILKIWKKKKTTTTTTTTKKCPGDTILTKCTKNYDHVLYYFWNMVHDKCNFYFSFWAIFCLFNCLKTQKIKILKIWKKAQKILKPNYTKMYDHIMCSSWDKVCNGYQDGWTDERMEQGTYRVGCPT